jgi:hypothetical protein
MQLIFHPSDDIPDTITVDMNEVSKMTLTEYGLDIDMIDGHIISIDALFCSEYEIEIKR